MVNKKVQVRYITGKEIFGDGQKHPLVRALERTKGRLQWRVLRPPVWPHMRITPFHAFVEMPHGYDAQRKYYWFDRPEDIKEARRCFEGMWKQGRPVTLRNVGRIVKVLSPSAQAVVKRDFTHRLANARRSLVGAA